MKIYNFDEIDSTNDFADRIKERGEDCIITARRQTNGHGTKGRSFISDSGGLYVTKLSFYADFPAGDVFKIMINTSVAACRTLERFFVNPGIKWPNDIYARGKKICGILINNTFRGTNISRSVVGIGLNIENSLPRELEDIAINMRDAGAKDYSFESVRDALIAELQIEHSVEEYKKYLFFLGEKIRILQNGESEQVKAVDVDELGRLIVEGKDGIRRVSAGEVSLRL